MAEKETINDENLQPEAQDTPLTDTLGRQEDDQSEQVDPNAKHQQEIQDLKDKYLRLYSEFENYRRRTSKERLDLIKTAGEDLIKEIIPIMDDFERAFKANENEADAAIVREGNQLVFNKLSKTLESKGLKPMEDLIGKPFNADTQEAITQIPAPTEDLKGMVIDVVEKGYTLGEKVIRFAKVVIGA
jgi:molecular chaperone GrpE